MRDFPIRISALSMMLGLSLFSVEIQATEDLSAYTTSNEDLVSAESSTVTYGLDFIEQQSGLVSVADLILRIPGGAALLNQNRNHQRGFSNGNDRILINGRRLSGKQNDSRSALEQLSVAQVERVEVIRGSSPDIKVSSQDSMVNVVLLEDAGGSGAWSAGMFLGTGGDASPRGTVSYGSKRGIMDYTLAAEYNSVDLRDQFDTLFTDGDDTPTKRLEETRSWNEKVRELRGGLSFNFDNGDQLNINGLYNDDEMTQPRPGSFLLADASGALTIPGFTERRRDRSLSKWELGGDYGTTLTDDWNFKVLGLYTEEQVDDVSSADAEILADEYEEDFLSLSDEFSSEAITRGSVVWQKHSNHRLEFGTEVALNKQVVGFQYFERIDGVLVEQDVDSSDVTIKEIRDESFAIHSWQISDELSLDSSLVFEYSKISQTGGITKSRTFKFLKPSWDLRYNLSPDDQLQFSVRREVSQLNFGAFASSVNEENDVTGGNSNLEPEKAWTMEASYEHRLADDNGSIKPTLLYQRFTDNLQPIETSPGVSGIGNGGTGTRFQIQLEGAIRLFFIGIPNIQLSADLKWQETKATDAFTGESIPFDGEGIGFGGRVEVRHDIPDHGLSWGLTNWINRSTEFRDFDELRISHVAGQSWTTVFVEKQFLGNVVAKFEIENLLDEDWSRERNLYAAGRAGGILTSRELRDARWSGRFEFSLRGTF